MSANHTGTGGAYGAWAPQHANFAATQGRSHVPQQPGPPSSAATGDAAPTQPLPEQAQYAPPPQPPTPSPEGHTRPLRVLVVDDNPVVRAGLGVLLDGRGDIHVVGEAGDGRAAQQAASQHQPDVVLLDVRMPEVDGIAALPHLAPLAPVLMLTYSQEREIVEAALRQGAAGYLVHGEFTADQLVQAVRDATQGYTHLTPAASHVLMSGLRSEPPHPPGPETSHGEGHPPVPGHGPPAPGPYGQPGGAAPAPQGHAAQPQQQQSQLAPDANQLGWVQATPAEPPSGLRAESAVAQSSPAAEPASAFADRYGLSGREVEVMELIASGMPNRDVAAACFISEKTVKNHVNRIFTKLGAGSRSEAIAVWLGTARRGSGEDA